MLGMGLVLALGIVAYDVMSLQAIAVASIKPASPATRMTTR
jgi:hypothetical protein